MVAYAQLEVECHTVSNLQAELFIGTDVMAPEGMALDFRERTGMIGSCHNLCFRQAGTSIVANCVSRCRWIYA